MYHASVIQIGLCLGLAFTFPIMVHPVNEILEENLKRNRWFRNLQQGDLHCCSKARMGKLIVHIVRAIVVVFLALLASTVPGFGVFVSFVGSTVCALLSFVLPATFHLMLLGPSLKLWQKSLDFFILLSGLLFAVYGTYNTVAGRNHE